MKENFAVFLVLLLESLDHEVHLLLLDQVVDVPVALQVFRLRLASLLKRHSLPSAGLAG